MNPSWMLNPENGAQELAAMEETVAKVKQQANRSAEERLAAISEVSKLESLVKDLREKAEPRPAVDRVRTDLLPAHAALHPWMPFLDGSEKLRGIFVECMGVKPDGTHMRRPRRMLNERSDNFSDAVAEMLWRMAQEPSCGCLNPWGIHSFWSGCKAFSVLCSLRMTSRQLRPLQRSATAR
jgi:hypothetical protein